MRKTTIFSSLSKVLALRLRIITINIVILLINFVNENENTNSYNESTPLMRDIQDAKPSSEQILNEKENKEEEDDNEDESGDEVDLDKYKLDEDVCYFVLLIENACNC